MKWEAQPLAQLAEPLGFSMADVAFLAGLEESTVSRLWDATDWLDRIKGKSLQSLICVLPSVADYAVYHSIRSRREILLAELASLEVPVNQEIFRRLVVDEHVPEQYIGNALQAAIHIIRGDKKPAAAHLTRFWGRVQDFVLGYLFEQKAGIGLLEDNRPLILASRVMAHDLAQRPNSFHAIVAQAPLAHYLARLGEIESEWPGERQGALAYRSAVIGRVLTDNSIDTVDEYHATLRGSFILGQVEEWAMPTYSNDAKATQDFSLPRSLLLRQTASEVIRQIRDYNDAYLYYLISIYLPLALKRDATFGLQMGQLREALYERLERCRDVTTRQAGSSLLGQLRTVSANPRGDWSSFRAW